MVVFIIDKLAIIFLITRLIVWSVKCQKIAKSARHNIPEHLSTYLNCLFYLTNNPKPKDFQFTNMEDLKNSKYTHLQSWNQWFWRTFTNWFFVDQLID